MKLMSFRTFSYVFVLIHLFFGSQQALTGIKQRPSTSFLVDSTKGKDISAGAALGAYCILYTLGANISNIYKQFKGPASTSLKDKIFESIAGGTLSTLAGVAFSQYIEEKIISDPVKAVPCLGALLAGTFTYGLFKEKLQNHPQIATGAGLYFAATIAAGIWTLLVYNIK